MKKLSLPFYVSIFLISASTVLISCKEKKAPEKKEKKEQPKVKKETPKKDSVKKVVQKPVVVPEKKEKIYTVQQDDWLWKISRNEYGTALGWDKIYQANRGKINNPNMIFPGMELIIPE